MRDNNPLKVMQCYSTAWEQQSSNHIIGRLNAIVLDKMEGSIEGSWSSTELAYLLTITIRMQFTYDGCNAFVLAIPECLAIHIRRVSRLRSCDNHS